MQDLHFQEALNRGLLPDDSTLKQLALEESSIVYGKDLAYMQWPDLELRAVLIRKLASHYSTLGLASIVQTEQTRSQRHQGCET